MNYGDLILADRDNIGTLIGRYLIDPKGRKYCLNFALADDYEVNAEKLRELFNPNKFMVKITPLHKTISCEENNIKTTRGYTSFTPIPES